MVKNGCRRKCLGKSLQRCSVKKFSYKFCKSHRRTPVPESLILQNSSGGYIWEFLKREIRKFTIHYTKGLAKKRQQKKQKKNKFRKPIKKRCQDNRPPDNCSPRQLPPGWLPQENCPPDNYPAPPPDNCPQGKLSPRCLTSDYCSHTITPMIIAPWQYPPWKLSLRKLAFGWFDDNCP